ncbi:hypothetical protein RvY_06863 [Ramazzottius varieornatus]|uniref:Uncharacterized protein n=1 Tax=Ramazzottius varieornatus TaxID=947166 RepID=A0A1D1V3D3_RAMVA|nr:hypothetical protein RvY_06863 [Ramazzottius varieornatus]
MAFQKHISAAQLRREWISCFRWVVARLLQKTIRGSGCKVESIVGLLMAHSSYSVANFTTLPSWSYTSQNFHREVHETRYLTADPESSDDRGAVAHDLIAEWIELVETAVERLVREIIVDFVVTDVGQHVVDHPFVSTVDHWPCLYIQESKYDMSGGH